MNKHFENGRQKAKREIVVLCKKMGSHIQNASQKLDINFIKQVARDFGHNISDEDAKKKLIGKPIDILEMAMIIMNF